MNLVPSNILALVAENVRELFRTTSKPSLLFHNYQHTENVVKACTEMADHYGLEDDDRLALLIAAWFHDTGYLTNGAVDHEKASAELARAFVNEHELAPEIAAKVFACIMATKMPQQPVTLIEKIICDADLFHLGIESFPEQSKALRQEINSETGEIYGKPEWAARTIRLLETHNFFTDYGLQRLEPIKQNNLKKLKKKFPVEVAVIRQPIKREPEINNTRIAPPAKRPEGKVKKERPDRGVETMFRTTSSNHLKLSEMADSKAHIMISVNSIILSVTISFLFRRLDEYPAYIIPTALLLLICIVAMVFAVLTTRPNVTSGTFVKEDILTQKPNLLFFGNFHKMSLEDYSWAMKEMMNDREYLYGAMIKDFYSLGVVLARKYRFLRISYNVFMFGMIAAVIAFAIASYISPMRF